MSDSKKQAEQRPIEVKRAANGDLEFHVTKRDGTVEIIQGPPGVTHLSSLDVSAMEDLTTGKVKLAFHPG